MVDRYIPESFEEIVDVDIERDFFLVEICNIMHKFWSDLFLAKVRADTQESPYSTLHEYYQKINEFKVKLPYWQLDRTAYLFINNWSNFCRRSGFIVMDDKYWKRDSIQGIQDFFNELDHHKVAKALFGTTKGYDCSDFYRNVFEWGLSHIELKSSFFKHLVSIYLEKFERHYNMTPFQLRLA